MPYTPCPVCQSDQTPPHVVLHVDQPVVDHQWCNHCLLPSAVAWPITVRCVHGWPLGLTAPAMCACLDCGHWYSTTLDHDT